jgi:hypothetical protein
MFFQHFSAYPWLSLLQVGFMVWMLMDAYRRPADRFWLWVILLVQPFGAWAYFVCVKASDFVGSGRGWNHPGGWSLPFFSSRPSLEELRYQAEHVPTLTNALALAERLVEQHEHEEALPHLELARAREPDHCQVLFLAAVCHAELGCPEKAAPELETVIARDRAWSDYAAWRLLIRVRAAMNDPAGTLNTCRDLVRIAPTLRHRVLLAEYLLADGQPTEARELLQRALDDYRFAPASVRRLNRRYAGDAMRLLKQAAATKAAKKPTPKRVAKKRASKSELWND